MKQNFALFLIVTFFLVNVFAIAFPYPFFSTNSTLTAGQEGTINDANEKERTPAFGSSDIKVVTLDWFEVVNTFFEKYVTVRVIDVNTKTQYYIKRTGGHYHADVEPIDKENMNKFHSIYNNEWSWARRPVWVEINGVFVAASINGMPHGYSLIENNGQNGHTCIHFLNSKTHGTKRVDEAHQEAVKTAIARAKEINLLGLR